jgi:hypothetical protein
MTGMLAHNTIEFTNLVAFLSTKTVSDRVQISTLER